MQKVVVQDVVDGEARIDAARQNKQAWRERRTRIFRVGMALFTALFIYLLVFSPSWIAPGAVDPIAPTVIDDGLRVSIFLTVRQVEGFREEQGRLPTDLDEAGGGRAGVVYQRLDDATFRISATTRGTELTYLSSEPLDAFVGGALRILEGGS